MNILLDIVQQKIFFDGYYLAGNFFILLDIVWQRISFYGYFLAENIFLNLHDPS